MHRTAGCACAAAARVSTQQPSAPVVRCKPRETLGNKGQHTVGAGEPHAKAVSTRQHSTERKSTSFFLREGTDGRKLQLDACWASGGGDAQPQVDLLTHWHSGAVAKLRAACEERSPGIALLD
mmetsp:Transcript_35521/g.98256  ORF Transcript_35521/g.98256 Transcript_35521/m.98256 type:complete len:123 (-) Transcript_35521:249-617(-)